MDVIYDEGMLNRESRVSSDSTNTSSDTQQQSSSTASGHSVRLASSPIRNSTSVFREDSPPRYDTALVHREWQSATTPPKLEHYHVPAAVTEDRNIYPCLVGLDYSAVVPGTAVCRVKPLSSDSEGPYSTNSLTHKYQMSVGKQRTCPPSPPSNYQTSSLPVSSLNRKFHVTFKPNGTVGSAESTEKDDGKSEAPAMSIPPHYHDVIGSISRPIGQAGTVTVTPLTARRLKALAPTSQPLPPARHQYDDDVTTTSFLQGAGGNNMDDVTESKATVYDNVQTLSV